MKNLFILIISALIFFSCSRNKNFILEANVGIFYHDIQGNDLLNPKTLGYYPIENMHLFRVVNGVEKEYDILSWEGVLPSSIHILRIDSLLINNLQKYFLSVDLDLTTDTVHLRLNSNLTDTLVYNIDRNNGNALLTKFWYNGELCWEKDTATIHPLITIIK